MIISNPKILDRFHDQWSSSGINHYYDFIRHLDIGILPVRSERLITDDYKVVNEKKWLLAKLKYGL